MASKTTTPNIVIIGGSYGGIGVAQNALASIPNVKVILISTSKDLYFNIAAPRILAKPNSTPLEKVIFPIKDTFFAKYSTSQFEFIHATATGMDTTTKTVSLSNSQTVNYDHLVIASGSHTTATEAGIPVKQSSTDNLHTSITSAQNSIAKATTIVIGGGGSVAVEMAGEIAEAYPKKALILVSGSSRLLPTLTEKASGIALKHLKQKGVDVILGVKISKTAGDDDISVELDNGKVLTAQLYIPAVGIIPNSAFIPAHLLDPAGYLITTPEQKVSALEGVYGLGDVTNNPAKRASAIKPEVTATVANLKHDILGSGERQNYKEGADAMFVPIGGKGGVAQIGTFVLWSWVVWLVKGNYFISMALTISGLKKQ